MNKKNIKKDINFNRTTASFKAVHIQCLNDKKEHIKGAYASGFILDDNGTRYLCTCWHVVTGYNMHNIEIGKSLPNRKYLQVNLQRSEIRQPGVEAIGGKQSSILSLYDDEGKPLWIQNKQDKPHYELNNIGLKVPFWHDIIMLPLPEDIQISDIQLIESEDIFQNIPYLGEKILIVGYPYGYSSLGMDQPTPIVLTRHIAAQRIKDRHEELLLDGPGAPGMSGGPAFIEYENKFLLFGLYTGLIFPDYEVKSNEKTTALGTMNSLKLWKHIEKV